MELDFLQNLDSKLDVTSEQSSFAETTIGKCLSTALDVGISIAIPDCIEKQVIEIKDNIFNLGFPGGLKKTFENLQDVSEACKSLFKGKFNSVEEYQMALSDGGVIDTFSKCLTEGVYKLYKVRKIKYSDYTTLNKYKNVILDSFKSHLKNSNKEFRKTNSYINNLVEQFETEFENKNSDKLKEIVEKLNVEYKNLFPTKNMISKIENVLNQYELLESKNFDYNFSKEEMELLKAIS